ncbi:MAG: chromosome segregation protein SMC, partial [Candidatus Theseobacter exili]|nr:chromosome segregation protein SMC [Candidatus Theseobacter exili]
MFLKKIEIVGFKSFASRTILDFEPKVTAIVGPNGCGKSNIGDAVRWVLGEQNPRLLRGTKMEDVIFNGTDEKKPIGRAEVSLTFDNSSAGLSVEFSEVKITRRLFRSGDSEYYINKTPCRLKDIRNLVLDTGIGTRSYFLMEQGKIDLILSSKPEERRQVFEEAAGINKYKTQKKEALSKLESTEKNLNRINDILREVKRQIGSVQRQAGQAKQYQKIRDELKDLEIKDAFYRKKMLDDARKKTEEEIAKTKSERKDIQKQLEVFLKRNDVLKKEFSILQSKQNKAQKEKMETIYKAEQDIDRTRMNKERIKEISDRIDSARKEEEDSKEKIVQFEQQYKKQTDFLDKIEKENGQDSNPYKKAEKELKDISLEILNNEKEINEEKSALMDSMNREAQMRNEMRAYVEKSRILKIRFEKIGGDIDEISKRKKNKKKALENIQSEMNLTEKKVLKAKKEKIEKSGDLRNEQEKLKSIDSKLADLNQSFVEIRSRKDLMKEMQSRLEGCSESVKSILSKSNNESQPTCRLLSDILRIPEKYEPAAESILEHSFQNLVVQTVSEAENLLEYLRSKRKGRASIMPLNLLREKEPSMSLPLVEGLHGFLTDLIKWEKPYELAVKALLGDVVVVDHIDQVLKMSPDIINSYRFVSLDGEILSVFEGLRGGEKTADGEGLLTRKSKIDRLEKTLKDIEVKINLQNEEKNRILEKICKYEQEMQCATTTHHDNEIKMAQIINDHTRLSAKIQELKERINELKSESEGLEQTLNKEKHEYDEMTEKIVLEEKSQKDIKIGLDNDERRLVEIKGKRENLYIEHARLKASMEAAQERRETAQKRLLEIKTTIREMSGLRLKREDEINSGRQKIEQLSRTIVNIGNREDQYEAEKRNLEHEENSIESEIGKVSLEIKDVEDKIDTTRKRSEQIVESYSKTEVISTEQRIKSQTEEDRIWEKYEVHLSDTLIDLSQNAEIDRMQIDKLKEKISNIGPVNLVAIDEFNSLKERYDLLSAQHKDLIDSSASLVKIIERINETTELMFLETFEKIRQHFKVMFSKLLGGGKADL